MDIKGLSFIILVCTIIGVTNAGNFLILGDWGGIPIRPYTTDIEESTANQMSVTATQKNSKFVKFSTLRNSIIEDPGLQKGDSKY